MLLQGLVILVVGLFIVFAFLLLLVLVLEASKRILPRFNHLLPDEQPRSKGSRSVSSVAVVTKHDAEAIIAVAIAAAIAQEHSGRVNVR